MQPLKPTSGRLEEKIQRQIVSMLEARGWLVIRIVGGQLQNGLPDLYITHTKYGGRWLEVKRPLMLGSRWTAAQLERFPLLMSNGTGIWILTGSQDRDYELLFKAPNLWSYMEKPKGIK